MADTISFVGSDGTTINLRSNLYLCNPRECKDFKYSNNGDYLYRGSKEFSLTVLCLSNSAANSLVNTMEKDTQANKFSKLVINGWYCLVKFMGISVLQNDEKGLIKLSVSFYAPSFVWYSDMQQALEDRRAVNSTYPFVFSLYFGTNSNGDFRMNLGGKDIYMLGTSAYNQVCHSDYFKRQVVSSNGSDIFGNVTDTSDFFAEFPAGSHTMLLQISTSQTGQKIIIHRMRGCPEW